MFETKEFTTAGSFLISTINHRISTLLASYCLDSHAECSKASSAEPAFSFHISTCFLNCDMASRGADA